MKKVTAPLRIDLCGGALDIQPIPLEMGPTHIISAAINHRVEGVSYESVGHGQLTVSYRMPKGIPTGSGLGSSGVMNLVWLALISDEKELNPHKLASGVYNIEQAMGVVGGTQDQFTSAYGGLLKLTLSGNRVFVEHITANEKTLQYLSNNMVLINTNIQRVSTDTSSRFIENYKSGCYYSELRALDQMSKHLYDVLSTMSCDGNSSSIRKTDFEIKSVFDNEWKIRKIMYPSNKDIINDMIARIKNYAGDDIGIKVLGAAGGGCMLAYVPDLQFRWETLGSVCKDVKCSLIDFHIEEKGIEVIS